MQNPNPHPPAVVRGLPKAAIRFGLRGIALPLLFAMLPLVATIVLVGMLPITVVTAFGILLLGLPPVVAFALIARYVYRFQRFVADLAANPSACLNCGYPTVDAAGICPECGHVSDRNALNRQWRANLARLAPDPPGGPAS